MKTDQLHAMRHSLAHIMAAAIKELHPGAKFGVGPVIESGFYYDVDLGDKTLTPEDLPVIEHKMQEIIKADLPFETYTLELDTALVWAREQEQPYKIELLEDLKQHGSTNIKEFGEETIGTNAKVNKVSFYKVGDFDDLCRGPHLTSSGQVGAFKLHKIAGAYWRGDEHKPMLQRIYGVAFTTQTEVDNYFKALEEAKRNDHRVLGKELDLFVFSDVVGSGLPLFTPRGTIVRNLLVALMHQAGKRYGAQEVSIPHIAKRELYETSGHAQKFGDELLDVKSHYDMDFVMKPVNCPHHIQIYAARPRSYKDLPLNYMQTTMQYRDEKPGQLMGLSRVRAITVDDGHIFCSVDQIKEVILNLCKTIEQVHSSLGLYGDHWVSLSVRDSKKPDDYIGDAKDWDRAEAMLQEVSDELGLRAKRMEGEAALYGPKLDFMYPTALGKEIQLATIQLDFAMPKRFKLEYIDEAGKSKTPIIIHRAVLGSLERFMVVLLEKTSGRLPFWLAPEQVRILTVNDAAAEYAAKVSQLLSEVVLMEPVKYNELRFEIDDRNESLGKKIREAEVDKVPVVLIVGPKDEAANEVSVRTAKGEEKVKLSKLAEYLAKFS